MTTNSPSVATALSNSSTANFLSSLNSSLGAGGALSGLFENLLASAQTVSQLQTGTTASNANVATASNTSSSSASTKDATSSSSGNIGDLYAALQNFATKWNNYQNAHHNDSNAQSNASQQKTQSASSSTTANTTASPSATTSGAQTTSTATAVPATTSTSSAASSTASDSTATDPNAPPSFADLLSQLQAVLQMLQKQIQAAQATTTGGTQTNAGDTVTTSPTQDLLAAGGALADLLALAQSLEKKLGGTPSSGDATTATANNAIDPNLAALDTQVRTNLKTLLDNLKTAAAANSNPASDTATTAAATATTDITLATTQSTTATPSDTTATTPDEIIKGALATADDFMKQLNSLYGSAAPSGATMTTSLTANAVASASGGNNASLDSDQDSGAGNAATNTANTNLQNAASASAATENPKSANPYSFASQLSATRAQNGGTTGLPTAVEQVLLQMNRNAKSGNDQMSIQLHPADLGTINIKLDFASNGTVSGTVVANNADTLSMLQKDSRSLERALQEAGLRADPGSLQFSLGGQSNNNSSGQSAQNQSSGSTASNTSGSGLAALTPDAAADTTDSWVITPGRVNIRV